MVWPSRKRKIHKRDGYVCQYCAIDLTRETATVDHVIPKSHGGKSTVDNLVTCCDDCNTRKGALTPTQAGMPLLRDVGVLRPHAPDEPLIADESR